MISIAHDEKPYVRKRFTSDKRHKIVKEKLPIGDYVVGNLVIERKQINDLYTSMIEGRLFRQLDKIQQFCDAHEGAQGVLIIEGYRVHRALKSFAEVTPIDQIIVNCLIVFNIIAFKTNGLDHTVSFIKDIDNYSFKGVPHIIKDVRGFKPQKSVRAQQKYFLQGLPTIGEKRVANILKDYKNPMDYFQSTIIDPKNTQIFKVLTGDFNQK